MAIKGKINFWQKIPIWGKAIAAIISLAGSVVLGINKYDNFVIARNEEKRQETQFRADVLKRLDAISVEVGAQGKDIEGLTGDIGMMMVTVKALDRSHAGLLKQTGKIDLLLAYQQMQLNERRRQDSIAKTREDVKFNMQIQPINGKKNQE